MKTIVALVDLSEDAFKVLKQVHQMAAAFGSRVVLLHVVPPQPVVMDLGIASPTVMETPSPEAVEADGARLQELQDSLSKFGISVDGPATDRRHGGCGDGRDQELGGRSRDHGAHTGTARSTICSSAA